MIRAPFHFGPRSLSARVFWLTVIIIFVVDLLLMLPGMGREWQNCLRDRMTQAQVAVTVAAGHAENMQTSAVLSKLSGTFVITLQNGLAKIFILPAASPLRLDPAVDLDRVTLWQSVWQAGRETFGFCKGFLPVDAAFTPGTGTRIEIVVDERPVAAHLRGFVAQTVTYSVIVAVITGGLVYAALDRLLVRPMRIMTANIVAFRRNPEYARLSGLKWLSDKGDDEISRAARELVVMQDELRTALWRNAQLAALGTAIAKISHDLRGILATALLVAGRIQRNSDPVIQQASSLLTNSIERAIELVTRTVDSAGGRPPPVNRSPVALRELAEEVADFVRQGGTGMAIENLIPGSLVLKLDRNQIYRVLVNLLQNAAEAKAGRAVLTVEDEHGLPLLVVADNGPGLPRKVMAGLFQPFTESGRNGGTGLGLAIARDLIRAHGGDLRLRKTGLDGTEFVMTLPDAEAINGDFEQSPAAL